jgi:hypothetical protein
VLPEGNEQYSRPGTGDQTYFRSSPKYGKEVRAIRRHNTNTNRPAKRRVSSLIFFWKMSKPSVSDVTSVVPEEKEKVRLAEERLLEKRLAEERAIAALKLQRKQRLQAMVIKRKRNFGYLNVS